MRKHLNIARGFAVAFLILTYALLVHHVNATGQSSALGATLALIPFILIALTVAHQANSLLKKALVLLITGLMAWVAFPYMQYHTALIFWLQDIGLMTALCWTFAHTLQPGKQALCVRFAEIIHGGDLPPEHARYAYNVTIAWTLFFLAMIITSTGLFFLAPLTTWSFFVNFMTLPLVALMFVLEYALRRQLLKDLPTGNVLDAVRAYMEHRSQSR